MIVDGGLIGPPAGKFVVLDAEDGVRVDGGEGGTEPMFRAARSCPVAVTIDGDVSWRLSKWNLLAGASVTRPAA